LPPGGRVQPVQAGQPDVHLRAAPPALRRRHHHRGRRPPGPGRHRADPPHACHRRVPLRAAAQPAPGDGRAARAARRDRPPRARRPVLRPGPVVRDPGPPGTGPFQPAIPRHRHPAPPVDSLRTADRGHLPGLTRPRPAAGRIVMAQRPAGHACGAALRPENEPDAGRTGRRAARSEANPLVRRTVMILATTTVENVDRFLEVFGTKVAGKRALYGSRGSTVFRDPTEENRVWGLFDMDEAGGAKFVADPGGPGVLREAGAPGKPEAARPLGVYRA